MLSVAFAERGVSHSETKHLKRFFTTLRFVMPLARCANRMTLGISFCGVLLDETDNLQKPNPLASLPYVSAACRRLGRGVSKPLPASGRGLPEGFVYTLKTFQTSSKRLPNKKMSQN